MERLVAAWSIDSRFFEADAVDKYERMKEAGSRTVGDGWITTGLSRRPSSSASNLAKFPSIQSKPLQCYLG